MIGILRIFYGAKGTTPWVVLTCLLVAGIFEGVGLITLLPLLSLAIDEETGGNASPISLHVEEALGVFGLTPSLGLLLCIVVGGVTLKGLLTMLAMKYVGNTMAEVATNLRTELIRQLLTVRWQYFTEKPVGSISNAISVDATRAGQAYLMAATFQAGIIKTGIYVVVAALISWQIALIAVALGGTITISLHFLVRITKKAGRRQTERTSELVTYLSDTLSNIKPLKAMAKSGKFANLFETKIEKLKRALRRQVISKHALMNLQEMLAAAGIAGGFYIAITRWNVPVSELMVMGILLVQAVANVSKMQRRFQKAVQFESPYWSMRKLIAEAEAARETNPGTKVATLTQGCRFDAVSFAYGNDGVLDQLSLEIPADCLTVLTGASGAGKTTLIDLLLGLHQPQSGRILIDGVALNELDLEAWRRQVGYVPQELILFHDTILANVTLGDPHVSEAAARAALEAAGAGDFISALPEGLQTIVGEKGTKLSGGQRQRIALARALAGEPKLLILDEVTSALDPETEKAICQNIDTLSHDMTILAITHREAWIDIAERSYHLDRGSVELVTNGRALKQTA